MSAVLEPGPAFLMQNAQQVIAGRAAVGSDFASGCGLADTRAAVDLLQFPGGPAQPREAIAAVRHPLAWMGPGTLA
jgi:hypothetical protein